MKRIAFVLLAFVALSAQAKTYTYETVKGDPMQARIYTLDNGLKVYLTRNVEKPEILTYIAVHAGAQNDPLESTGLAHYQEHIMFKGTTHYGTTNYAKEKPNLDAIDSLYEVYCHSTDSAQRLAIYHQIDSFSYDNSHIAIANEFDKLMDMIGASSVNAYTSNDRTCYHEVIPAGELRRWAMIESDRFQNLVVRGFHTELETVYEEYNMYSTMDQMKVMQAVDNLLYPNVPYRQHTVIGTPEHLKNPSLKNIKNFYSTYYRPNNVAICLSGDLDFDHTIAIIDEYFGSWKPNNNLPKAVIPEQAPLAAEVDTIVYGKEAPEVWLAWQLPNVKDEDIPALEMMSSVMSNGKCGLLDLDIAQQQLLLGAEDYLQEGNDFSTYFLIGVPKEGQNLDEVRTILLKEVEKLKKGEFSAGLLQATINNYRRNELSALQNNNARVNRFLLSFIFDMPYEQVVNDLDQKAKVTKEDIVRVANKYLSPAFACVMKQQGEDKGAPSVNKPSITPIDMNRGAQSDYYVQLSSMKEERLSPQYLDFDKDISRSTLRQGVELLYRQNNENDLASLSFVVARGSDQDPVLDLASDMLSYLGTKKLSPETYQASLYALAAETWATAGSNELEMGVYGLQESLPAALRLMEDWVLTATPNDEVYRELCVDRIKAHEDAKSSQRSCFRQLISFGFEGGEAIARTTLTPDDMKQLTSKDVLAHLRRALPAIERIEYYGPLSEKEVVKMLKKSKLLKGSKEKERHEPARIQNEVVKENEVWIAPYDANNIYLIGYANWGEVYSPKDEAIVRLYDEYFSGSMSSVVFQEMREARALCYSASASYVVPAFKGDCNYFFTYIISQNDKMQDCLEAFDSICNVLPRSEDAFLTAKTALLKSIESRRYVRSTPINKYVQFRQKGWDHDYFEDIYQEVQKLTLDDVVAWQREHVANRTYRYLILGNEDNLDIDYLKTKGAIRRISVDELFVY